MIVRSEVAGKCGDGDIVAESSAQGRDFALADEGSKKPEYNGSIRQPNCP